MIINVLVSIKTIPWLFCDPRHVLVMDGPPYDSALFDFLYDNALYDSLCHFDVFIVNVWALAMCKTYICVDFFVTFMPFNLDILLVFFFFFCTQMSVICIIGASGWFVYLAACSQRLCFFFFFPPYPNPVTGLDILYHTMIGRHSQIEGSAHRSVLLVNWFLCE